MRIGLLNNGTCTLWSHCGTLEPLSSILGKWITFQVQKGESGPNYSLGHACYSHKTLGKSSNRKIHFHFWHFPNIFGKSLHSSELTELRYQYLPHKVVVEIEFRLWKYKARHLTHKFDLESMSKQYFNSNVNFLQPFLNLGLHLFPVNTLCYLMSLVLWAGTVGVWPVSYQYDRAASRLWVLILVTVLI